MTETHAIQTAIPEEKPSRVKLSEDALKLGNSVVTGAAAGAALGAFLLPIVGPVLGAVLVGVANTLLSDEGKKFFRTVSGAIKAASAQKKEGV